MKKQNTNSKTFTLVGLAILTAIIIVLQVVTTYFPTKPFAITLALIPIVIGSALYGAKAGAYLGAVFSVVVLIMCAAGADAGGAMVFYANPAMCILLCLLKGSAAGFVAGLIYNAVSKKNQILGRSRRQHGHLYRGSAALLPRRSRAVGRRHRHSVLRHHRSDGCELPR